VEGNKGTAEIAKDYWLRITTESGTYARRYPPAWYPWVDPNYHVIHSSIVPCNAQLLQVMRGQAAAETSAEDNLKTLKLVVAAYESARSGNAVSLNGIGPKSPGRRTGLEVLSTA
jgi:predicted dehydrogenase